MVIRVRNSTIKIFTTINTQHSHTTEYFHIFPSSFHHNQTTVGSLSVCHANIVCIYYTNLLRIRKTCAGTWNRSAEIWL